jgi:hypothetical protein
VKAAIIGDRVDFDTRSLERANQGGDRKVMNDIGLDKLIGNPLWLLAAGGAIGLALSGLFWGLAELVPALGIAVHLASTGTAAGFAIAPSLGTAASVGLAAGGAALTILVSVRITKEIRKEPYKWGLPVFGVVTGFLVLLCEEYWKGNKFTWYILSAASAMLVVVGAAFYARHSVLLKGIGILLHVLVPVLVLLGILYGSPAPLLDAVLAISPKEWTSIGVLLLFVIALAVLAWVAERQQL